MLKRFLKRRDNPWEVLVVSALFFFPGLFMLFHRGPLTAVQQLYRYDQLLPGGVTVISEHGAHIFGGLAIGVGVALLWLYVYLRRELARTHVVEHGHERI
jgi:hypothetical protein